MCVIMHIYISTRNTRILFIILKLFKQIIIHVLYTYQPTG